MNGVGLKEGGVVGGELDGGESRVLSRKGWQGGFLTRKFPNENTILCREAYDVKKKRLEEEPTHET